MLIKKLVMLSKVKYSVLSFKDVFGHTLHSVSILGEGLVIAFSFGGEEIQSHIWWFLNSFFSYILNQHSVILIWWMRLKNHIHVMSFRYSYSLIGSRVDSDPFCIN